MKKYVLEVTAGLKNSAGLKAKEDVKNILIKNGFDVITFNSEMSRLKKLFCTRSIWKAKLKDVKNDLFVFQYPMYSKIATKILIQELNKRNAIKVAVIHDINSLRMGNFNAVSAEVKLFNQFDYLIVHNSEMKKWLLKNGAKTQMISLDLFDYLNEFEMKKPLFKLRKRVVFAGNLEKSRFLGKLKINTNFDIFGPNPMESFPPNVNYKGVYDSEVLPKYLDGGFGLVWDGDSVSTCTGIFGEYTKYNNPHKVSLYLSMGLPVIVWDKAAIANFVKNEQVGIVVSSLTEIDKIIDGLSEEDYYNLVNNAKVIGKKVRAGYYTTHALSNVY